MRLAGLDPRWVTYTPSGRSGMGISFACPCCLGTERATRLMVAFTNPIDGGPPAEREKTWQRSGDTFETLSLSPSIDVSKDGHWHGFVTNGEVQ